MAAKTGNGGDRLMTILRIAGWGVGALVLLAPLLAMQTGQPGVVWSGTDFVFAALVLGVIGAACELVAWRSRSWWYRAAGWTALAATFGLIWGNAAVGFIGDPLGANALYAGVIAIALIGAMLARFRAGGTAVAMAAAGVAQVLIGVVALAARWGVNSPSWPWDIVGLTIGFGALWFVSAALFRKAAGENTHPIV